MTYRTTLASMAAGASIAAATAAMAQESTGLRYERLPAEAYVVVAEIRAKRGKEDEMRKATMPLVAQVRGEPNNLLYFLHENREAPGHFVFYEIFANKAAFEAHQAMPHVQAWFARLPDLAEGGVKLTRVEILNNTAALRP